MPPTSKPPGSRAGRSRAPKLPLPSYSDRPCEHCGDPVPGVPRRLLSGRVWVDPGNARYCSAAHRQAAHRGRVTRGEVPTAEEREAARLARESERIVARLARLELAAAELDRERAQLTARRAELAPRLREVV